MPTTIKQWTCDGCGEMSNLQHHFPIGWQQLEVKKRTDASSSPIRRGKIVICSTACAKRALMRFWDRVVSV